MHAYEVGKPCHPSRRSWPEGNQYQYRGGAHDLVLFTPRPTRAEVEAVRIGGCEFALRAEGPLISLCYRFGSPGAGIPWSDANYSWHLLRLARPDEATFPPPWEEGSPELRAVLHVILVNAEDGTVRALRLMSFSPGFTAALHRAIWDQAHRPWDPAEYQRALDALYHQYSDSESLARACAHRTIGDA